MCCDHDVGRGVVPFAVELGVADSLFPPSMLRHFSNYVVGRGQRVEGAHQVLRVAVAPDPPKARFRLHQRARHPALNHLTATPPLDVACVALDAAVEVLDDVRRAQRTLQRPRQAEGAARSASP